MVSADLIIVDLMIVSSSDKCRHLMIVPHLMIVSSSDKWEHLMIVYMSKDLDRSFQVSPNRGRFQQISESIRVRLLSQCF